ncbi:hypothetical protein M9H77_19285 [Catharanthus roseus]|uniref:Uncharacterized protein n=1 Tax=Catharanthus roseus TaxID=4058 RepID=A0ACC0B9Z2_CATRO|nr:hypothetical protein M9H77_19285 [Catharanthus roseus]
MNNEEIRYLWTIQPHLGKEGIHILVEFEHIQQQNIPNTQDRNTTTLPEHITAVTQMVSDEPSMLYSTVNKMTMRLTDRMEMMPFQVNTNRMMTTIRKKESSKLPEPCKSCQPGHRKHIATMREQPIVQQC